MTDEYENEDDCPFSYPPGKEPPPIVHKVIGKCASCGEDAFTIGFADDKPKCWACAMGEANW